MGFEDFSMLKSSLKDLEDKIGMNIH